MLGLPSCLDLQIDASNLSKWVVVIFYFYEFILLKLQFHPVQSDSAENDVATSLPVCYCRPALSLPSPRPLSVGGVAALPRVPTHLGTAFVLWIHLLLFDCHPLSVLCRTKEA